MEEWFGDLIIEDNDTDDDGDDGGDNDDDDDGNIRYRLW